jgi:calcineurin-like phosphoesterase family protein
MSTWFLSDLHLGHKLVSELRGFATTDEHDAVVLRSLDRITADDVLWVLGDVTVTGSRERLEILLGMLGNHPARKHLISGNHDNSHPMHHEAHKWLPLYGTVFASVQPYARIKIPGTSTGQPKRNILLSHLPYSGDSLNEDRYAQYRLPDLGLPLVHGHTHSSEILSRAANTGGLQINVCWEAWHRPVRLEEIVSLMPND